MARTRRFQIDSVGNPQLVIAQDYSSEIEVTEERSAATANYTIRTLPNGDLVTLAAGSSYIMKAHQNGCFVPGQSVAEIKSVGATMWFVQKEN